MPRIGLHFTTDRQQSRGVLEGISQFAREHPDWEPILCGYVQNWTPELVAKMKIDGLIGWLPESQAREAIGTRIPVVSWASTAHVTGATQVINDHRLAGELAAQHLFDRGYRSFASFVDGTNRVLGPRVRDLGFYERVQRLGCRYHQFLHGPRTIKKWSLHNQIADLGEWLTGLDRPIGVMGSDDEHAWRVIEAADQAGLSVPGHVGVIGWQNDISFCEFTRPTLTSIASDEWGIGYRAAAELESRIAGTPAPDQPVLIPPLGVVGRKTTGISVCGDEEVNSALQFIREHLADDIAVDDIARHIGVSRRTAQRLFAQHLNRGPGEEIRLARTERAMELLRDTDLPMVEIAIDAGFPHISQLTRAVKQTTGLPPSQYRTRFGADTKR